ncbi:hypothetical protein FACS189475_09370 [Betaproteobacteria bacterium]|nr:hypothetical protein FACS189475_09370 [Betaproteobacteria bacterium]
MVNGNVFGGKASSDSDAKASGNQVKLENSKLPLATGEIFGGHAQSNAGETDASGNTVELTDGSEAFDVTGGYAKTVSGSATATASGNTVELTDSKAELYVRGGDANSDSGAAEASDNHVKLTAGSETFEVIGGMASIDGSGSAAVTASGNYVTVDESEVDYVYGGNALSNGDGAATASDNHVTVTNNTGAASPDVIGGAAYSSLSSGSATATINIVTVTDSAVASVTGGVAGSNNGVATATGNRVTLNGSASVTGDALGGDGSGGAGSDFFSGNTLEKNSAASKIEGTAGNFEYVKFDYTGAANIAKLDLSNPSKTVKLDVSDTHNVTFGSANQIIGATGGLEKTGLGTLTLSGTNTYSGGTTVGEGTLSIGSDASIGGGTNTLKNNTTLQLSGSLIYNKAWTLDGGATPTSVSAELKGALTGTGGSLTKTGPGTLTLSGTNSYGGNTTVDQGTLSIGSDANIGDGTNTLKNNTTLQLSGNGVTYTKNWTLVGNTFIEPNDNTATLEGQLSGTGFTKTGTGFLVLTGDSILTGVTTVSNGTLQIGDYGTTGSLSGNIVNNDALDFTRSDTYTHTGDISGTGILAKFNTTGVLTLNGDVNQGGVNLFSGTLNIAAGNTVNTSGAFTVADGATLGLNLGGSPLPVISAGGDVNIGGTGTTLKITGYSGNAPTIIRSATVINGNFTDLTINGNPSPSPTSYLGVNALKSTDNKELYLDGELAWNRATNAHGTFDIAALTDSFTVGVALENKTPSSVYYNWDGQSLTKDGLGTLILTENNTYTGGTAINNGTLALSGSGSIAASSGVTLANVSGALFDISNASDDTTIKGLNGGGASGGDVNLGGKNLTIDNSTATADNIYNGVIDGTGSLTKTGAGTLILTGTNTYGGGTTVNGGTLSIGSDNNIGTPTGGATNTLDGATLQLSGIGVTYAQAWTVTIPRQSRGPSFVSRSKRLGGGR